MHLVDEGSFKSMHYKSMVNLNLKFHTRKRLVTMLMDYDIYVNIHTIYTWQKYAVDKYYKKRSSGHFIHFKAIVTSSLLPV